MEDSQIIRRNLTNICKFLGPVERGDMGAAHSVLIAMDLDELRGAFLAVAAAYGVLARMSGVNLHNVDNPDAIETIIANSDVAMNAMKGRMGYN